MPLKSEYITPTFDSMMTYSRPAEVPQGEGNATTPVRIELGKHLFLIHPSPALTSLVAPPAWAGLVTNRPLSATAWPLTPFFNLILIFYSYSSQLITLVLSRCSGLN